MKKTIIAALVVSALMLAACGKAETEVPESTPAETESTAAESDPASEEEISSSESFYEDTDDTPITDATVEKDGIEAFLEMPDYAGLELTKEIIEVTDEDAEQEVSYMLQYNPVELPDDTAIETGMVANIDYLGTVDGEAFDGGEYQGYDLEIGSGSFIEGFEEQLIGHKKGESFDITVTFPDDYYEELAGKEAVFSITINAVKEILAEPTDEWAAAYTDYDTAEEYLANVKSDLEKLYNSGSESQVRSEAWEKVIAETTFFQYPQDMYDVFYENAYQSLVVESAEEAGMTEDEYKESWGIDDDYVVMVTKEALRQELAAEYILQKEGIAIDGPEVEDAMNELLSLYGYVDVAEIASTEARLFSFRNSARSYLAAGCIVEKANITEAPYEEPEYELYGDEELPEEENG